MNRTVLVSGASRGLGAEIARHLAAGGWTVGVNYARDSEGAAAVVGSITAAGGQAVEARFDVTDEVAVAAGIAALRAATGPVLGVVNNAIGAHGFIDLADQTWQDHLDCLAFTVKAPLLLLQAALPDMRAAGWGRVVNVGSEVASTNNARFGHYGSAKAATVGLTRSWASELAPEGITVNVVEPGWIPVERHEGVPAEALAEYAAGNATRTQGVPADVAATIAFLMSDAARFVVGQRIAVNGGRTMP